MKRAHFIEAAACLLLIGIVAALYRKVLRLWWMYDDAFHLHLAGTFSFADMLFSPRFWAQLPNKVFTPLLYLSMKSDMAMFGTEARPFYLHHLIAAALAAVAMYAVARCWLPVGWSFVTAALALAGPPMCEIVEQLFHRHYLEGLIFALLSILLFVRALRSDLSSSWSGVAYFVAMAAKEVYVPLIVVLLVIPEADWRSRSRRLIGHGIALAVYCIWRLSVMGPALSGYGLTVRSSEWPQVIGTLPFRALTRAGGAGEVQSIVLLALLALAVASALFRHRRLAALTFILIIASLAPVAPVAVQMETRFVLTLWISAVAIAAAAPRPLLIMLMIAALFANRAEWSATFRKADRMSNEARFFSRMNAGEILDEPLIPPAAIAELARLTRSPAQWLYDDSPTCNGLTGGRLFAWYEPLRAVRHERVDFVQRTSCRRIRVLPLNAAFNYERGTLLWRLGPYAQGTYSFILGGAAAAFDVPRDAGFRLGAAPGLALRIRYTSPAGWVTYSPEIALDFIHDREVTWRR